MKKNFEDLYNNIIHNPSLDYNKAWKKAKTEKKTKTIIFIIISLLTNLFILYINTIHLYMPPLLMISFIFIIDFIIYFLLTIIFSKHQDNFKIIFKSSIIGQLLNNFYDSIVYLPQKSMPIKLYNAANYKEYYNKYYSDDYMTGLIQKKHPIKMGEIKTVNEIKYVDSSGNTHTKKTTIFHGLFTTIILSKSINSILLIRNNGKITSKSKLEMDYQEFENHFDVLATDKIIGMQLLTHDIMELLISFKKFSGITYDISIYNNVIYLRFHTKEMFELKSLKKGAFDKQLLHKYFNILNFTYKLSTMLIDLINKTEI